VESGTGPLYYPSGWPVWCRIGADQDWTNLAGGNGVATPTTTERADHSRARPSHQRHPVSGVRECGVRRFFRNNSLSVEVVAAFLLIWLVGQTTAGLRTYNAERRQDGEPEVTFGTYLTTAHFGEATFENWESEFLQMGMYVVLTVKLRQRGSSESKPLDKPSSQDEDPLDHRDDPAAPWPVRRGGAWLALYRNSLSLTFMALFVVSFLLHALTGSREFNSEQTSAGSTDQVSMWGYMNRSQFWFESLQNWQSEFLAVAAIVLLSVVLRQHGSPESKPVHAPTSETGT
jgi:hypothetical protein